MDTACLPGAFLGRRSSFTVFRPGQAICFRLWNKAFQADPKRWGMTLSNAPRPVSQRAAWAGGGSCRGVIFYHSSGVKSVRWRTGDAKVACTSSVQSSQYGTLFDAGTVRAVLEYACGDRGAGHRRHSLMLQLSPLSLRRAGRRAHSAAGGFHRALPPAAAARRP